GGNPNAKFFRPSRAGLSSNISGAQYFAKIPKEPRPMRMNGPDWKQARVKLSLDLGLPSAVLYVDDVAVDVQACFPEDFIMGANSVRIALSHLIKTSHSFFFEAFKMAKPLECLEKHTLMKNLIAVILYPRKA